MVMSSVPPNSKVSSSTNIKALARPWNKTHVTPSHRIANNQAVNPIAKGRRTAARRSPRTQKPAITSANITISGLSTRTQI